ncbi:Fibronectin type 3 domain [Branchiostoma belcheri]|nr:Fibronectin type 3 domain [Branchiostoma belcheri]
MDVSADVISHHTVSASDIWAPDNLLKKTLSLHLFNTDVLGYLKEGKQDRHILLQSGTIHLARNQINLSRRLSLQQSKLENLTTEIRKINVGREVVQGSREKSIAEMESKIQTQEKLIANLTQIVFKLLIQDPPPVDENYWTAYKFQYDDTCNSCHGDQYVKRTKYDVGKYVGVVLCTPTRYKIFLSDSLTGLFRNVADRVGQGQDHCEFLGSARDASAIDPYYSYCKQATGFWRRYRGEDPKYGPIGYDGTGKFFGRWYECGMPIP